MKASAKAFGSFWQKPHDENIGKSLWVLETTRRIKQWLLSAILVSAHGF
jgi:hypothetical protein